MYLKNLKLSNEDVEYIANKVKKPINEVLESEVYTTSNFADMAKWIREYDSNALSLIDDLDTSYVVDPSRSLLENFVLYTEQVFEIDDYILFVYI